MQSTRLAALLDAIIISWYGRGRDYRGDTALQVLLFVNVQSVVLVYTSNSKHYLLEVMHSTCIFVLTVVCITLLYRLSPFHPLWKFPGPFLFRCSNLAIMHMVYTGKRHLVVAELHARYGPIVRIGPNKLSVNDLRAQHSIYTSSSCMNKSLAYRPAHSFDGGLFFIRDREAHNERRRMWAGAFSRDATIVWYEVLDQRMADFIACIIPRATINLSQMISRWSYDVMGDLTFGKSNGFDLLKDGDHDRVVENGEQAMVLFDILGEVPALLDIFWYLPFSDNIHTLLRFAAQKLQNLKGAERTNSAILSHLLREEGEEDKLLTDEELVLDTVFAIQAGSDTTSGVLILLLYYILADRDIYNKLTCELDEAVKCGHSLDIANLHSLPYLHAVVQEGIRLGTPFPGLPRIVPAEGAVLADTYIPGNTIVSVPAYAQQVSSDNFFPSPLKFCPDRWLPGAMGPDSILNPSAVMCFSTGPFACLGKSLAIKELHAFVARLLLSCHVELASEFDGVAFMDGVKNMRTTVFTQPLLATVRRRTVN